jgi:hypothetical protein
MTKEENTIAPPKDEEEQDEVEDKPPVVEEVKVEETPIMKFEKMTKEEKQKVVDMVMDIIIPRETKSFKFNYHGFESKLKPEGYEIPENEKLKTENHTYAMTDYISWYPKQPFREIEYRPPMIREKLQLSLWKIDNYGVVKVKFKYFTPKSERLATNDFSTFKICSSLDNNNILLEETLVVDGKKMIIIIDPYSLEIKKEFEITVQDPEFKTESENDYYDNYYDDPNSRYPTKSGLKNFYVWNHGKYILS